MKRLFICGAVTAAVLALTGAAVATASAEEALWLVAGAEVTSLTSFEIDAELLFEDMNAPIIGISHITCVSFILDGSIGPKGNWEITEILNLAGQPIKAKALGESVGEGLLCEANSGCESSATETQFWPSKLPLAAELTLDSSGQILGIINGFGGTVLCLVLGATEEDECSGTVSATMENMTGEDALAVFGEETAGNCQLGGNAEWLIGGAWTYLMLLALEVTVDSP